MLSPRVHGSIGIDPSTAHLRKLNDVGHYVMEDAPEEVIDEARKLLAIEGDVISNAI